MANGKNGEQERKNGQVRFERDREEESQHNL